MMNWFVRTWLPLAIGISGVAVLVYGVIQQSYRQSLNDPQVQIAEDGAAILSHGGVPAELVSRSARRVDAMTSLAPWISVLDASSTPLESSAVLSGKPPVPPQGALDAARANAGKDTTQPYENRITWEIASGTRIALVILWVPQQDRYVIAGRNMREVELREWALGRDIMIGWITTLIMTLVAAWLGVRLTREPGEWN